MCHDETAFGEFNEFFDFDEDPTKILGNFTVGPIRKGLSTYLSN